MPTPSLLREVNSLWRMGRRAASVFPLAVGATRRRFSPLNIGGMAALWGGVGSPMPSLLRPLLMRGWSIWKTEAIEMIRGSQHLDFIYPSRVRSLFDQG